MPNPTYSDIEKQIILNKQLSEKISNQDIVIQYKISIYTIYHWRKVFGYDLLQKRLKERELKPFIKVTTELRGINQQYFINDCAARNYQDGKMLKHIIDVYYSMLSNRPDIASKEMADIKSILINIVKL